MKKHLLVVLALSGFSLAKAQIQGYTVGQTVADFTVTDTDGNVHTLYSQTAAGKYVVLDFFFTTCPPCQATQPYFNQLHDKYGCNQGDLFCISINTGQDNNAAVIAFENTYGGSFQHSPAVSGDGGSATVDNVFNPAAYPTYCLIGPDNKLLNADIWPINSVADYEAAFPVGSGITAMACTVGLTPAEPGAENSIMEVFPNPASSVTTVTLNLPENLTQVVIEITDLAGRVALTQVVPNAAGTITSMVDVAAIPEGTYMVLVKSNEAIITTKRMVIAR